jgi:hypothetical protein
MDLMGYLVLLKIALSRVEIWWITKNF